jgi:hypothetical protein
MFQWKVKSVNHSSLYLCKSLNFLFLGEGL